MDYRWFSDSIIVRVDQDEEILDCLRTVAENESVQLADISGLGTVKEVTVGFFDPETKEHESETYEGTYEITSLTGTVTVKDKEPYLHMHMSAFGKNRQNIGGHLDRAVVTTTAEIVMHLINGRVGRTMDSEIGLNLFGFEGV